MYKAVLFSLDGAWVTDSFGGCKTIKEVEDNLADMGSKWYFYPLCAVITDNRGYTTSRQRIVNSVYPLDWWKGHTITAISDDIIKNSREYEALLDV